MSFKTTLDILVYSSYHSHSVIKQTNDNCSFLKAWSYSNYIGTTVYMYVYMNVYDDMLHMCSNFTTKWTLIKVAKVFIRTSENLFCGNGDYPYCTF